MTKEEIRRLIRDRRRRVEPERVEQESRIIERSVIALPEFEAASVVSCYAALPREIRTDIVMGRCWSDGKRVCVPAFQREADRYGLAVIRRGMPLVEGPAKVLEPAMREWVSVCDVDFFVVPGLAFDCSGGRLGYGGGNYDRLLASRRKCSSLTVGLAFEFQVFDRIPVNESDVRLDVVITERRVMRSAGRAA